MFIQWMVCSFQIAFDIGFASDNVREVILRVHERHQSVMNQQWNLKDTFLLSTSWNFSAGMTQLRSCYSLPCFTAVCSRAQVAAVSAGLSPSTGLTVCQPLRTALYHSTTPCRIYQLVNLDCSVKCQHYVNRKTSINCAIEEDPCLGFFFV